MTGAHNNTIGGEDAGETLEESRLAGAIGADEAQHFAFADREAYIVEGNDVAEAFVETLDIEEQIISPVREGRSARRCAGRVPCGGRRSAR